MEHEFSEHEEKRNHGTNKPLQLGEEKRKHFTGTCLDVSRSKRGQKDQWKRIKGNGPDVVLPVPNGGSHGLYLEMKF